MRNFRERFAHWYRWTLLKRLERYQTALAYAQDRTTPDQALTMLRECQHIAGTHCLVSLDVDHLLEDARERWKDHPNLERYCQYAAARVAGKWSDDGELRAGAVSWALDLVKEYAEGEQIELVDADEDDEQEAA